MGMLDPVRDLIFGKPGGGAWSPTFVEQMRDTLPDDSLASLVGRLTPVRSRAWRPAGIREALGVPSIFRAVSLIATTTGALSLDAYRNGVKMPAADRPRIMVRPDPFRRPRAFFRDTAWNMASRGEAIWWVAVRDPSDDSPLSVLNLPPHEVSISWRLEDLRFPRITWRGVEIPNADVVHLTFAQEPGELRGVGPLQLCGAAVSVAVEAQEFAANFYEGGLPSTIIKSALDLGSELDENGMSEADRLRAQWVEKANNLPRVIDPSIESITQTEGAGAGAAALESRTYSDGDAARMFGIPGSLLEFTREGSSVTYQNVNQELDKLTRICLWPGYLEEIEQAMSDLLTRSTVARFNLDAFLRADPATRAAYYKDLIDAGVITPEEARAMEGLDAGNVETAPMPFAPPAAIPGAIPIQTITSATGIASLGMPQIGGPRAELEAGELELRDDLETPRPGPEPIVTRAQVLTRRALLIAQGKPAGHASLARDLNVSESTIRRRLAGSSSAAA